MENGSSILLKIARSFRKSKGILINTFREFETCGVQALYDVVGKHTIPPVYPVGPILDLDHRSRDGTQRKSHKSIKEWLDDQPLGSVVFVCFGSLGSVDEDQVNEIAKGLENSGHRFLWSLQRPPFIGKFVNPNDNETYEDALPDGFLDRTIERGKVIGWAPQVSILAHSSVGGFVSHCGWNSILESMWFGVPMATWPLQANQQLNAFQLVKELGLAVEIRMDYQLDWKAGKTNFQMSAEEIETGVKKLMNLHQETRNKVRQMSDRSRMTLAEGGSSYECLNRFMQQVLSNVD